MAVAKPRDLKNQLLIDPYIPRSKGPAKFIRARQNNMKKKARESVNERSITVNPVNNMLTERMILGPYLSRYGPRKGEDSAAKIPPAETAAEIEVSDHPNSDVMGVMKIERGATAGPCRAKPAQQAQKRMTQP